MKRPYVRCFTFSEFKEIEKCKNYACCSYWSRFEALESEKNHERNKWTRSQNYYHQCYDDVECAIILAILCCSTFKLSDDRMKVMKSHCFVNTSQHHFHNLRKYIHTAMALPSSLSTSSTICIISILFVHLFAPPSPKAFSLWISHLILILWAIMFILKKFSHFSTEL